ncbi:MAG: ATP-binding protein [Bacteroidales bacterium]|nr:ATP-binding protein [Bacteroidales bacterium]
MGTINNNKFSETHASTVESLNNPLLESIVDSHDDPVILCNSDFLIEKINSAAYRMFQTINSNAIGGSLFDYLPEEIPLQECRAEIKERLLEIDNLVEFVFPHKDDTYNVKVSLLGSKYIIIIKNLIAHTEHIEESNFRMLFENMSSGFVFLKAVSDDSGNIINHQIIDVNSTFEIIFNKDKHDVVGHNIEDVLPDFDETWNKALAKSARTGGSYSGNYHLKNSNKHFEVRTYSPRKGYSAAVFNDIKQEMEIRNDLIIKSEVSKAFAMGHDSNVYKVVLDLVLKNTESQYGFIGYVQDNEVVCFAKNDDRMATTIDEHGNEVYRIISNTAVGRSYETRSQILVTDYNEYKYILVTPVLTDNDTVVGFIGSADSSNGYSFKSKNFIKGLADYISPLMVSEVRERNYRRELVEAKERAEANERLKTTFLANISHEIRTPMNGICGFSELLAKSDNLSDKQRKFVDFIIKSTHQLLHIVEDIMDMSKLQTQQSKINLSEVNINKMLAEVYNETLAQAKEKHISLDLYTTLPDDESVVSTDYYKCKKIISCLVSNGIKFTNTGGVSYGYTVEGSYMTFFVEDTGIGIRKELHEGIFTSFSQAENAMERKYNGAGVGLSICKGFVDLLGGQIWLNSAPNEGSTFYVKFNFNKQ